MSLRAIAKQLNARGIITRRNGRWHVANVRNLLQRIAPHVLAAAAGGPRRIDPQDCWTSLLSALTLLETEWLGLSAVDRGRGAFVNLTEQFLSGGAVRLLDGATGTELQKRGVQMAPQAWCGPAALDHSATLAEIHRDYIQAGADIITANTYATARHMLSLEGLGAEFERINASAVKAARDARDDCGRPDVRIAGSLSHRGPIIAGTAQPEAGGDRVRDEMAASLRELVILLRDEGCDFLLLEMLYDPLLIPVVLDAAEESGLQIWAGFAARRGADGQVIGFNLETQTPLAQLVSMLASRDVAAAGIMHTPADLVADALAVVRNGFEGPLIAYPDSGYFASPQWMFEDMISPEDLHGFAQEWVTQGVQVIGGCCGLGPEHIAALAPLRRPS